MRGVDLNLFDFDYDLTWAGFFMNADGGIYGRYGGREDTNPDKHLSLAGLKSAMKNALEAYVRDPNRKPESVQREFRTVEEYPSAKRLKADACIHCHQVTEFRRDYLRAQKLWTRDQIWVYPPPSKIGITLAEDRGGIVSAVARGSDSEKAGIRPGDRILSIAGRPVAAFADAQYALHRAPDSGRILIEWERGARSMKAELDLPKGWKENDISWRATMWGLPPAASVYGDDLKPEEKRAIGIPESHLAFRMGNFVPRPSRDAGIRAKDIITGIDGRKLEMTMLQFNAWIRLNFKPGDRIVYDIIRNGQRLQIPMVLADKDSF